MHDNEVLEEIRKYREEYAKSFNYDVKAMFNDLRKERRVRTAHLIFFRHKKIPISYSPFPKNCKSLHAPITFPCINSATPLSALISGEFGLSSNAFFKATSAGFGFQS